MKTSELEDYLKALLKQDFYKNKLATKFNITTERIDEWFLQHWDIQYSFHIAKLLDIEIELTIHHPQVV